MDEAREKWLGEMVEQYRREGSLVLSEPEREMVLRAMEAMKGRGLKGGEEKGGEGFSPFMYPH